MLTTLQDPEAARTSSATQRRTTLDSLYTLHSTAADKAKPNTHTPRFNITFLHHLLSIELQTLPSHCRALDSGLEPSSRTLVEKRCLAHGAHILRRATVRGRAGSVPGAAAGRSSALHHAARAVQLAGGAGGGARGAPALQLHGLVREGELRVVPVVVVRCVLPLLADAEVVCSCAAVQEPGACVHGGGAGAVRRRMAGDAARRAARVARCDRLHLRASQERMLGGRAVSVRSDLGYAWAAGGGDRERGAVGAEAAGREASAACSLRFWSWTQRNHHVCHIGYSRSV